MSTPFLNFRQTNLGQPRPESIDWAARLIPGTAADFARGRKKPPQSIKLADFSRVEPMEQAACTKKTVWESLFRALTPSLHSHGVRHVLIVGSGETARRIAGYIQEHPEVRRSFCGFLDDEQPMAKDVLGGIHDLPRLARAEFVDEIILASPRNRENALRVVREARKLRLDVQVVPDLYGCEVSEDGIEDFAGLPVFCLHKERLPRAGLFIKRAMDIVGACLALFGSPVLALIAALIKFDSEGPVIYAALRAGRKGKPFRCYKFRTMVNNADDLKSALRDRNERSGPFFKIAADPRITRVGRFLRRTALTSCRNFGTC